MKAKKIIFLATMSIGTLCCSSCGTQQGELTKLEVTKQPNKLTYVVGETFDTRGMVVTGTYFNESTGSETTSKYNNYYYWCGDNNGKLRLSDTTVKITDVNDYNSKIYTTVSITVNRKDPGPAPDPGDYYTTITDDMNGNELKSALQSIIKKNIQVSYDWSRYEAADEDINNSSNITTIYARTSLKKNAHVSGGKGWNREHTFPQSKISSEQAKSDNHIVFASDSVVNGVRSNYRLTELSGSPNVTDSYGNITPCKLGSKSGETFFDPGDTIARGVVARATMYACVMYGFNPTYNFDSIKTMLSWHEEYPPEECDYHRNEAVFKKQKNRNPFVDHPEYAERIWG